MRSLKMAFSACLAAAPAAAPAWAEGTGKLHPGYHMPPEITVHTADMDAAAASGLASHTLQTLPSWSRGFTVEGKTYGYTLLGTDPASGPAVTIIPTVLVPFRITVPDYKVNGKPLVLDATPLMRSVIDSPIFTDSKFDTGNMQFADAMLHAEFPTAPKGWHLLFSPSVAPTIDVTAPVGAVTVQQAKSGKYLGIINNGTFLNKPFNDAVAAASPQSYVIFVSYNSLFGGAFGFHSDTVNPQGTAATVWAYNSWLVGVDDLFTLPSPNADTFAHEIAETVHDALGFSRTKEWGDWFNKNQCFQNYIEMGDAVEDAPAVVQNYKQKVSINGRTVTYTLQTEALLPWFEREYPSSAIHGAYSFPGESVLLGPAPFDCVPLKKK